MDTYYSAMKRNELLIYRTTWLNLKHAEQKQARHKRVRIVQLHSDEILEKANLTYSDRKYQQLPGAKNQGRK